MLLQDCGAVGYFIRNTGGTEPRWVQIGMDEKAAERILRFEPHTDLTIRPPPRWPSQPGVRGQWSKVFQYSKMHISTPSPPATPVVQIAGD